jgi:hypothetical protein
MKTPNELSAGGLARFIDKFKLDRHVSGSSFAHHQEH